MTSTSRTRARTERILARMQENHRVPSGYYGQRARQIWHDMCAMLRAVAPCPWQHWIELRLEAALRCINWSTIHSSSALLQDALVYASAAPIPSLDAFETVFEDLPEGMRRSAAHRLARTAVMQANSRLIRWLHQHNVLPRACGTPALSIKALDQRTRLFPAENFMARVRTLGALADAGPSQHLLGPLDHYYRLVVRGYVMRAMISLCDHYDIEARKPMRDAIFALTCLARVVGRSTRTLRPVLSSLAERTRATIHCSIAQRTALVRAACDCWLSEESIFEDISSVLGDIVATIVSTKLCYTAVARTALTCVCRVLPACPRTSAEILHTIKDRSKSFVTSAAWSSIYCAVLKAGAALPPPSTLQSLGRSFRLDVDGNWYDLARALICAGAVADDLPPAPTDFTSSFLPVGLIACMLDVAPHMAVSTEPLICANLGGVQVAAAFTATRAWDARGYLVAARTQRRLATITSGFAGGRPAGAPR